MPRWLRSMLVVCSRAVSIVIRCRPVACSTSSPPAKPRGPMARALVDRCRSESRAPSRPGVTLGDVLVANGAHPVPDRGSVESGLAALRLATATHDRGECLVVLLSGGASAMLAAPAAGLSLPDKIDATRVLLQSGLPDRGRQRGAETSVGHQGRTAGRGCRAVDHASPSPTCMRQSRMILP